MDRFLEEVVRKHKRTVEEVLYYLSIVMMVGFGILALLSLQMLFLPGMFSVGTLISTVALIGMSVYLFLFHDRLRTEYDYTFTNGSMDFAVVYNNKKRKSLGSLNVQKVDAFGKIKVDASGKVSGSFQRYISMKDIKQLRWFLNRDAELYYFYFQKDGKKSIIVIEPSEEMVDHIRHYLPYGAYQEN